MMGMEGRFRAGVPFDERGAILSKGACMKSRLLTGMLFLSAVRLFCAPVADAFIFNVINGDVPGLKAAINTANGNNQDDLILLAANGSYTLTNIDNFATGPNGLPVVGPDNGGPTLTCALYFFSPAIDAGANSNATVRDQRGYFKTSTRDIGAFEFGDRKSVV